MKPAVFLDKDGTLVEDVPWTTETSDVRFFPDVFPALRLLHQAGFALVIVTNQSGVAEGRFEEDDVLRLKTYVCDRLSEAGAPIDGFYYCPHHPQAVVKAYRLHCLCRKPQPGLLMRAAVELGIDLPESWMVGDILHDVEAGRWAGCRTILLDNGHETEWELKETRWPDYLARSLMEAARLITLSGPRGPAEPTRSQREGQR